MPEEPVATESPDDAAAPPVWRRRLFRAGQVVLVGLMAVLGAAGGGLGLGSVWASSASDDLYVVQTRVIPHSQIDIPTSVGTATFDTHRWGPGARVEVSAQAIPPVGRSANSPRIDIDAQIDQIQALARETIVRTAQKTAVGALGGAVLGVLVWYAVSGASHTARRRVTVTATAGVTGGVLCLAGWGAGSYLSFDEEYGSHLEADGLLAVGLSADKLLAQLNARDQKYAGYVQSLATYISRLREGASPERQVEVATRVMLVSDIHGRNVYPQLAEVIKSEDVDFVIDSGDLVQWGTGFELSERDDLREGIESLGVPYVFVKGNHDGNATVDELATVPNVVVVDDQRIELKGLGVFGVGDPRRYQDGGPVEAEDPDGVEEMERGAAEQAVEDLDPEAGPIDLAVMHHPSGARQLGELLEAPVWVSGHTHSPALEVSDSSVDLTVGTTGAAGIRTFRRQDETGEVVATPQSFDILNFNSECAPVSLTRFSYPDALSEVGNALVTYQTLKLDRPESESPRTCE
ncbi:MAG: metallophosphoesterase family protein [Nocardioidaceae bacterium]